MILRVCACFQLDGLVASYRSACVSGTRAQEGWPNSAYGLSKVAVTVLTRILAREAPNGGQAHTPNDYTAPRQQRGRHTHA